MRDDRTRWTRTRRTITTTVAALTIGLTASGAAAQDCPDCAADLTGDSEINVFDLLELLGEWGTCADAEDCPADLAPSGGGDGQVNVFDLLDLLGAWGDCGYQYAPYEPDEAVQIALEMLGPDGALQPSTELVDRIERDLGLIRAEFPDLTEQPHNMAWEPDTIIVELDAKAPMDDYECLKSYYGVLNESHIAFDLYLLEFPSPINVPAMAAIFDDAAAVVTAGPNGIIGGQNFYQPSDLGNGVWEWFIDDGFHDCFDGCDCHYYYTIEVDAEGDVELIDLDQVGYSWCSWDS